MISNAAKGDVASLVAVNTTLGAAAGALSGMFTSTILDERKTGIYQWDTTAAMNGCLTGLVGITAGCATVDPWAAFVIGIVAGWIYLAASALMIRLKIDDAVDAIPVHMFGTSFLIFSPLTAFEYLLILIIPLTGGAWGVISTGLFSNEHRLATAEFSAENLGWYVINLHLILLFAGIPLILPSILSTGSTNGGEEVGTSLCLEFNSVQYSLSSGGPHASSALSASF